MPPATNIPAAMDFSPGVVVAVVVAVVLATLGVITCAVSHYKTSTGAPFAPGGRGDNTPASPPPRLAMATSTCWPPNAPSASHATLLSKTGISGAARGMSRELAAQRDRQVRLASVQADLELDLPPHITLPDGEELPYGSSNRLQIRDPEQEREIYQKCIRPPPNRTVFDGESPPPYRSFSLSSTTSSSNGAGVSGGCCGVDFWGEVTSATSPSTSSLSSSVVRCQSVSVPVAHRSSSSSRRLSAFSERHTGGAGVPNSSDSPALASLTMVPCHVPSGPSQQPTRATDSKRFI